MKKSFKITLAIILLVVVFSTAILIRSGPEIDEDLAKCIGENSELYVQLGCNACEVQEKMFGDKVKYLNIIDCWFEREKCSQVQYTPTWIINSQEYRGVRSIEELKKLCGC